MVENKKLLIVDNPIRIPSSRFSWIGSEYGNVIHSHKDDVMARVIETILNPASPYFGWSADIRVDGLSINNVNGNGVRFAVSMNAVSEFDIFKTKMEIEKGFVLFDCESIGRNPWWRVW